MALEIWENVQGYEGLYLISNLGRLLSAPRNGTKTYWHLIAPHKLKTGYVQYQLCKNDTRKEYKAHRLVAMAFLPNPENKREVNHIDGNPGNNTVDNLEWATTSENQIHAHYELGKGIMPVEQLTKDGELIKIWGSIKEAAKALNICAGDISRAASVKRHTAGGYKWRKAEE